MIIFISLTFMLITFYWVSLIKFIYSTKLSNNKEEAPFGIPKAITEEENNLRVKTMVEHEICYMLEIDQYHCD